MRVVLIVHDYSERAETLGRENIPAGWRAMLCSGDQRQAALACLARDGVFDYAIWWPALDDPRSWVNFRRAYRLLEAAQEVNRVTAKHFPVGLYGSRIRGGELQDVQFAEGYLSGSDVLHGPVCLRPSLAASLLSHGQAIQTRAFTEALSISVALAYRRCCYALLRDLKIWPREAVGNVREHGWSSRISAVL